MSSNNLPCIEQGNNNNDNNNNIIFIQVKLVQLQCAVINQGPVKPNYNRK